MAYTDAATVKATLGIEDAHDDALLTALIARAQGIIDSYCNRTFEAASDSTRYFDAERCISHDRRTLFLDADLCQITAVINGDGVTISSDQYVTIPRNETPWYEIRLKWGADSYWTWDDDPEDAISVTGRWAYSVTAPVAIQHACIRLATWLYRQTDTGGGSEPGQSRLTAEGIVVVPSALPEDVTSILNPFRRLAT